MNESTKLIIKSRNLGPILGRHPWVFSKAFRAVPEGLEVGAPVKLYDEQNRFLAQGYFNSYSQITVRIWSYEEQEVIDKDFFRKRIERAFQLRKDYIEPTKTNAYRLVYGESDFLPGLIVDKYDQVLVLQFHTKGIERYKDLIVEALREVLKPKGIYERSDSNFRGKEERKVADNSMRSLGLPRDDGAVKTKESEVKTGLLFGTVPDLVKINENGLLFWVDVKEGQKTGFFLDQRDKRLALQKYVKDKSVLNCFSYTGGFSVYALAGGAKKVVSVDISEKAIELAKENFKLNKLPGERAEFIVEDVKEYLKRIKVGEFEVIVLDPPAFIKDRFKIKEGISGYKRINYLAMKSLTQDGLLLSCSCSHHLDLQDFRYVLSEAAGEAQSSFQIVETFGHGLDHPQLVAFREGEYLKAVMMRKMRYK